MAYSLLADLVVAVHFGFVVFVVAGGAAVRRSPWIMWIHLPAVAWGIAIEWGGGICPLTPLEIALRQRAGQDGYEGDFLARYLEPVLYPVGLTRATQIALGVTVLAVNVWVYAWLWRRGRGPRL